MKKGLNFYKPKMVFKREIFSIKLCQQKTAVQNHTEYHRKQKFQQFCIDERQNALEKSTKLETRSCTY